MDQTDRDTIQRNIVGLTKLVDVESLYRELIQRGIIDSNFVQRIKARYTTPDEQAQEFFLNYTKRGPLAFDNLIEALTKTGHISEAQLLRSTPSSPAKASNSNSAVSSTTGDQYSLQLQRNESTKISCHNQSAFATESSSSNSPTSSSTSVPNSPLMRLHEHNSRVEPLSRNSSRTSSSSSVSVTDHIEPNLASCSMDERTSLVIDVKKAEYYNMGEFEAYRMHSKPRGFALLINNIEFSGDPSAKRTGAETDSINLKLLLEQMGFEVMARHNVDKTQLTDPDQGIIKKFLEQFKGSDANACVVAIMSHGKQDCIRTSDAEDYRYPNANYCHVIKEIVPRFNNRYCPELAGKPKIFIVQACQGRSRDRGVRRTQTDGKDLSTTDSLMSYNTYDAPDLPESMPETEDIIVCWSTVPGFVSNRDIEHGTWYIRTLCEVFMENAWNKDLLKLLQMVGLRMRHLRSEFGEKQMSQFQAIGFHYSLYFNPGLYDVIPPSNQDPS